MKNKNAQVAAFIIMGLIVLAGIIILMATKEKKSPQIEMRSPSSIVEEFAQDCINGALMQGLNILSIQGGRIYISGEKEYLEVIDKDRRAIIEENGRKRIVLGREPNKVPYWILREETNIPSLESIKYELERYIEEESMECIDDFKAIKELGYNVSYGKIKAKVDFTKEVNAEVSLKTEARKDDETLEYDKFKADAPINLKLLHQTAVSIASREQFSQFIEDTTNNVISLYSGARGDRLPPKTAVITSQDCSYVSWKDEEVKQKLKDILEATVSYISINGTDFSNTAIPKSFVYGSADSTVMGLKAFFEYRPEWEFMEFDVKPKNGEGIGMPERIKIMPNPMKLQLCTFTYRYKYDLEFPVLVTVSDDNSPKINPITNVLEGKGFSLSFPIWAFICGNQNRVCTGKPKYLDKIGDVFAEKASMMKKESGIVDTMFCDEEQRASDEIKLEVTDSSNGVGNADVYYSCGDERNANCFIGQTDSNGELKAKFPLCYNGLLSIIKSGYPEKTDLLTTLDAKNTSLSYRLAPIKRFNAGIRIVPYADFFKAYLAKEKLIMYATSSQPANGEEAIVSLEGPTAEWMAYPTMNEKAIGLAPGRYKVSTIFKSNIVILPETINYEENNVEVSFNRSGAYKGPWISTSDYEFIVSENELAGKSRVEFFVLAPKRGNTADVSEIENIFDSEGNINAEIVYQGNNIVKVRGLQEKFENKQNERVVRVDITKKDYEEFLKPIII